MGPQVLPATSSGESGISFQLAKNPADGLLSHRCRDFQTQPSDSRDHPVFSEKIMQACTSISTSLPHWGSRPDSHGTEVSRRQNKAEFPPAAQTALKLLDWTLRGSRAVDRASSDALRPQLNLVKSEDYYEISIPWEKLTASTPERIPQAV